MLDNETDNTKRKRGRPKKEKAKLPVFTDVNEIREYILNTSLELSLECKDIATKKNNIKKPAVANAKINSIKQLLLPLKLLMIFLKIFRLISLKKR